MSVDARIAASVARLSRNVESQRDRIRAAMPADLLTLADALKARFGARLEFLETPTYTAGREPERGVVPVEQWEAKQPGISKGKSRSTKANPTGERE